MVRDFKGMEPELPAGAPVTKAGRQRKKASGGTRQAMPSAGKMVTSGGEKHDKAHQARENDNWMVEVKGTQVQLQRSASRMAGTLNGEYRIA